MLVDVHVLQLPDNWAVGQRAEVYIETSRVADAIALPNEYLQINNQDLGVLIFEDGKARWQPIELGVRGQNLAEVRQGLDVGTVVVRSVNPKQSIAEGRAIQIR